MAVVQGQLANAGLVKPPMWAPGLDYTNPLSYGLVTACPIWSWSGYPLSGHVGAFVMDVSPTGNKAAFSGQPDWRTGNSGGAGVWLRTDNNQFATFGTRASDLCANQFTAIWYGAQHIANQGNFMAGQFDTSSPYYDWGFYKSTSTYKMSFFLTPSGSTVKTAGETTASNPTGVAQLIAGTWDGFNIRLYINGLLIATTACAGSAIQSGRAFKLGGTWGSSAGYGQYQHHAFAVYNRCLGQGEIQQWADDPYQIFRMPQRPELWAAATVSAGAPGTNLPAAMRYFRNRRTA